MCRRRTRYFYFMKQLCRSVCLSTYNGLSIWCSFWYIESIFVYMYSCVYILWWMIFFFYYKSFNTKKLIKGFTTISNICIFYVHIIKFPLKSSGIKFTFSSGKRLMTTKSLYIALNIMPFFEMDFPIARITQF